MQTTWTTIEVFSLVALCVMFLLQVIHAYRPIVFRGRSFGDAITAMWWISVAVILGIAIYWIAAQYQAWAGNPLSKFFLPPYESFGYFFSYAGKRFAAHPLIALAAAIVFGSLSGWLNRKFDERFFRSEEPRMFALGIFLAGYPGFFLYIPFVLLVGAVFSLIYAALCKGRAPLYFIWFPAAIFVILIMQYWIPIGVIAGFNL